MVLLQKTTYDGYRQIKVSTSIDAEVIKSDTEKVVISAPWILWITSVALKVGF
jgi:hypothetical protein